ncbi:MAG: hypothetical protein H7A35_11765 [Planctomycetales bacterium]|nr:hypothetical protein [bacterium]UNM07535.1 MAG: hypothetical protein H7A35_11765 [Planctomycetales bacterium]
MKRLIQTTMLLGLLAILPAGCTSSYSAPLEIEDVRSVLEHNIRLIEAGINGEDVFLASQPISEQFTMDNNVAVRYSSEWTGEGVGSFRNFWAKVFEDNANIQFELVMVGLELDGDIATAHCTSDYTSQMPDIVPPEVRVATDNDYLQFERQNGEWLLRRWEFRPDPEPDDGHDEGEGGTV